MHGLLSLSLMWILLTLPAGKPNQNASEAPGIVIWTTHALAKIRPASPPEKSRAVEIFAARNEFEPFQIVIQAQSEDLENVDVDISDLWSAGARISKDYAAIYLESFLNLRRPSSIEGDTGEFPDALIPRVDRYGRERRNAFPFRVNHGRNQPLWVEIYVPPSIPPGKYSGSAMISVDGVLRETVPITLNVWNFTLPSTSSFKTSFGFSGVSALKQHKGRDTINEEVYRLTYLYAKAALWHRVSIHGGTMEAPPFSHVDDRVQLDWKMYDQEVGSFLDGTVFAREDPLYGAKATSAELRLHPALNSDDAKTSYMKEWARHFRDKGWFDRLFYYVRDEPAPADYLQLAALARLAHRADPEMRNLVTAPFDRSLAEVIDIWVPLINCFEKKPGFANFCSRTVSRNTYEAEIQNGKELWWYQSCASHGCDIIGGDYFRGWPSYVIDAPAIANRITQWLAWKYRIGGELYYSMDEAFQRNVDPRTDVYMHGGNGDGTLFYPGRPEQIGGRSPIPIESIRLKLIREGLEDYEYLALLSKLGGGDFADERARRIVKTTYRWEHDPAIFYATRRELGEELSRISRASQAKPSVRVGAKNSRMKFSPPRTPRTLRISVTGP
ncbi:MAG TPA: glycoside hydrolase domain-containing protein [Acidobacteriota bacterium]|jgi:hypothetical protein